VTPSSRCGPPPAQLLEVDEAARPVALDVYVESVASQVVLDRALCQPATISRFLGQAPCKRTRLVVIPGKGGYRYHSPLAERQASVMPVT